MRKIFFLLLIFITGIINAQNPKEVFNPLPEGYRVMRLFPFNSELFFILGNDAKQFEMWKLEGYSEPEFVFDLGYNNQGSEGSNPSYFKYTFGINQFYFTVSDTAIWTYKPHYDPWYVTSGYISSNYTIGDDLILSRDGHYYVHNGVTEDFLMSGSMGHRCNFNNSKFLFGFDSLGSFEGRELWLYDRDDLPKLVKDIFLGSQNSQPEYFYSTDNVVFFEARDEEHGNELWKYNFSSEPELVADIRPGVDHSGISDEKCYFKNHLYFFASDGVHDRELWRYDDLSSPEMVTDNELSLSIRKEFQVFGESLYYIAGGAGADTKLFEYKGTGLPNPIFTFSSINFDIFSTPTKLYIIDGSKLWVQHENESIELVFDMSHLGIFYITDLVYYDGRVFFRTFDDANGRLAWCYNSNIPVDLDSQTNLEEDILSQFRIFPNPTSSKVSIEFKNKKERTISIYDVFGNKLIDRIISGSYHVESLEPFPSGIYYISVITNSKTESFKILKTK